jgi:glycosyltransferase involved in cell wall biosynthesis
VSSDPPFFSIITASLNRAPMLAEAIASVEAQAFTDCEHIIVDGCSSDATAELLTRHPALKVIREPDRSVYDALNKGLRAATGKFIVLLNSDDLLAPGALASAAKCLGDDIDLAVGGAEIFEGAAVLRLHDDPAELQLNVHNVTFGNPLPNARFYRRELIREAGEFDLRYRLGSDRDWLLRVLKLRPRQAILEQTVYRYRRHGGSLTINNHSELAEPLWRECLAIAEDWLMRADLSDEERSVLEAWHRQQSIQASIHFLRHGPWSRAVEFMRRGKGGIAWWGEWTRRFGEAAVDFLRPRPTIAK